MLQVKIIFRLTLFNPGWLSISFVPSPNYSWIRVRRQKKLRINLSQIKINLKSNLTCYIHNNKITHHYKTVLLVFRDDYLRASRALLREIVRALRHDMDFVALCRGFMKERTESQFRDLEAPIKVSNESFAITASPQLHVKWL